MSCLFQGIRDWWYQAHLEEDEREQEWKESKYFYRKGKNEGHYCRYSPQENNDEMWQDDDFDTIGLDPDCLTLDAAPDDKVVNRATRVFHVQIENWKEKDVRPQGDSVMEQHIFCKHGGLKWIDPVMKDYTLCIQIKHHINRSGGQILIKQFEFWMDMMISWQTQTKKTSGKNGLQCSN